MNNLVVDFDIRKVLENIYRKRFFSKRINVSSDLVGLLEKTILERQPLKLFYLWGIHKKGRMNDADEVALSFLKELIRHIENVMSTVQCPVDFTLVLSDVHAEMNEVPNEFIRPYLKEVSECAIHNGWNVKYLSDVWKKHGLTLDTIFEVAKEVPDESVDGLLLTFASKYYGGDDKKTGAKRYQVARQLEKKIIEKEFSDYIHVSAADTRLLYLQPKLPHFQVWAVKRGISKKPWFMNGAE